jgi:aminoglycoside N3'-acetyltransferase
LTLGFKILKGQMSQFFQIAHLIEPVAGLLLELAGPTNTDLHLAELRMTQRQILAYVAYAPAHFAARITRKGITLNLR